MTEVGGTWGKSKRTGLRRKDPENVRKAEKSEEKDKEREKEGDDSGHVLCIIHAGAFHVYFRV